jgi:hypothetical protein
MKLAKLAKSVITLVAIGLMVSACGDETDRSAAALQDSTQESTQESTDPLKDTNVEAVFGSGTNICVKNSSSKSLPVTLRTFDTSRGDNPLPPGKTLCIEGTFSGGQDVFFTVNLGEGNSHMRVNATNQSIGPPRFYLVQVPVNSPYGRNCIFQGFTSMEENASNDGVLEYTVKRLPDTNWKEFELTLRDDPNPSTTGKTEPCPEVRPR